MICDLLVRALNYQGIDLLIDDIAFNLHLTTGNSYFFCFYVYEDDDVLVVVATNEDGCEEAKIVFKSVVESLEIVYESVGGDVCDVVDVMIN